MMNHIGGDVYKRYIITIDKNGFVNGMTKLMKLLKPCALHDDIGQATILCLELEHKLWDVA